MKEFLSINDLCIHKSEPQFLNVNENLNGNSMKIIIFFFLFLFCISFMYAKYTKNGKYKNKREKISFSVLAHTLEKSCQQSNHEGHWAIPTVRDQYQIRMNNFHCMGVGICEWAYIEYRWAPLYGTCYF